MTYGEYVSKYSVCSSRIIYLAGYKSPNMHIKLKDSTFAQLPPAMKRIILAMAVNLHYIYINTASKAKDDPYWFLDKIHATNFRIKTPKIFGVFTFSTRTAFNYNIERDHLLRKSLCLYLYTGIMLFIAGYDEGKMLSQHCLNTLPPDTSPTLPT
jgi:hypothetical protein